MAAFIGIVWVFAYIVSAMAIYQFVGLHRMVTFFPEGKRWWLPLCQVVSLVAFALLSHYTPF